MNGNYAAEWRQWHAAVNQFQRRFAGTYAEMCEQAPPVEDERCGVSNLKKATLAFERVARAYMDGVREFVPARRDRP